MSGSFSTSQTYTIGQGAKEIALPTYTSSDGCTDTSVTYTLIMNAGGAIDSNYATFDSATPKVTISTASTSYSGTHTFKFSVGRTSTVTTDVVWTLDFTNPCTSTTLTMPTISDVTGLLVGGSVTKTFSEVVDSAATTAGIPALCGTRTYSVTNSGSAVSWATITGPASGTYTITFAPNVDNLHASSPFTFKLHAVLASYTSVTADSADFTVTVGQYLCTSSTTYNASGSIVA